MVRRPSRPACSRSNLTSQSTVIAEECGIQHKNVLELIDALAIGQRNLRPDAKMLIIGRRYNRGKRQDGGHGDQKSGGQNGTPINVAKKLAKEHGVSERTVKRAGESLTAVSRNFKTW